MVAEGGEHRRVQRIVRQARHAPVDGERRMDRRALRRAGEPRDEIRADEVEQRRHGDEVGPGESILPSRLRQVAEHGARRERPAVAVGQRPRRVLRVLQQRRVIVHQQPALRPRQQWRQRAHIGARSGAEIDDRQALAAAEHLSEPRDQPGIAGRAVGRLAQRQP